LEKDGVDGKLAGLLKALKNLDNLIESQRSDKIKDGVGYSVVPPIADLYLSPKKDLSWTGLPECADDIVTDYSRPSPTIESTSEDGQNRNSFTSKNGEPTDSILSKHAVKFVKAVDRPAERSTTNKAETVKKPTVKYAEIYRRPSKKPTIRGNQQIWNNLKTQQLGPDFVMKKKACFNCGDFNHLAYDCRKKWLHISSGSGNNLHWQWEVPSGSRNFLTSSENALCILFPTNSVLTKH
nr:ubiquitin hydrolase [Tanacetum cinerariifolium]